MNFPQNKENLNCSSTTTYFRNYPFSEGNLSKKEKNSQKINFTKNELHYRYFLITFLNFSEFFSTFSWFISDCKNTHLADQLLITINRRDLTSSIINFYKRGGIFLKLGFTPCKAEQPLWGMELQEKEVQID